MRRNGVENYDSALAYRSRHADTMSLALIQAILTSRRG